MNSVVAQTQKYIYLSEVFLKLYLKVLSSQKIHKLNIDICQQQQTGIHNSKFDF